MRLNQSRQMPDKKGPALVLCGHGSRDPAAADMFGQLITRVRNRLPKRAVSGAFLEFNGPGIYEHLQELYAQGVRDIIAQPVMLYAAGHSQSDIPGLLADFRAAHPDVRLRYGYPLGRSRMIFDAAVQAVKAALPAVVDPGMCRILVVGRGTTDPQVNDQTIRFCQKLDDYFDFGDSSYCYFPVSEGGATPPLDRSLAQASRSHYDHVLVVPFLLLPGHLFSAITRQVPDHYYTTEPLACFL